ncbi:hypothetical protein [Streptomyces sp. NPDC012746]|uniref:hypothetical protein n=1 Tax=Streptomyces sp. NPDC012746 TaxID=3364845 RepID=UPI00367E527E
MTAATVVNGASVHGGPYLTAAVLCGTTLLLRARLPWQVAPLMTCAAIIWWGWLVLDCRAARRRSVRRSGGGGLVGFVGGGSGAGEVGCEEGLVLRGVDARGRQPDLPRRRRPVDGGTDGGEGYGWLLITRPADAVEVRPVPEGGKTGTRRHVVLTPPVQEAQLMCREREPEWSCRRELGDGA